jgi:hypothetical protein
MKTLQTIFEPGKAARATNLSFALALAHAAGLNSLIQHYRVPIWV